MQTAGSYTVMVLTYQPAQHDIMEDHSLYILVVQRCHQSNKKDNNPLQICTYIQKYTMQCV